jgi:hypothetical protein
MNTLKAEKKNPMTLKVSVNTQTYTNREINRSFLGENQERFSATSC